MPDAESALPDPLRNRIWCIGSIEFDESRRELRVGGQIRLVEAKPLLLLETLLARAGDVVRKEELLAIVWQDRTVVEQSLTTAVSKLRAALGDEGRAIIEAVHGVGYRIGMPIELRAAPERPRLAFTFQAGDPVPNRPQWCLDRPLGPGRARDVWLAVHSKTGERRVFKFADTTQRLDALRREAALSRILYKALGDRPDLVRISEWNFDIRPFFIESSFGGDNLADWTSAHGGIAAIPLARRIAIVARIARTAADAHDVGVLHRDIKPANILVSGEGNDIAVRLVDFGSGRLTEAAALEAVTIEGLGLTDASTGEAPGVSGTLRYMAPEIIAGGAPTIAADVYAIGILLYQMIVADLDRPLGAGWEADIADPLLRDDVRDAASSDAKRRLASAQVLAERLEGLEKRRTEHDRVERIEREASRLAQQLERARARRPWLIFGVASLALGLFVTAVFAIRTSRARDEALRQANITRQVNDFLTEDLLGRANPRVAGKPDETLIEAATNAEPRIDARLAHEPLIAASLYLALARAFDSRSAYAEARADYQRAARAYDAALGNGSADAIITRLRQAQMESIASKEGSLERAKALIDEAEPRLGALGPRSAEARVWFYRARGAYLFWTNDIQGALRDADQAERLADALPGTFDRDDLDQIHVLQSSALTRLSRWDEAQAVVADLIKSQTALHGPSYPDTLIFQRRMAQILVLSGRPAEAIPILNAIYPKLAHVLGDENRETLLAVGQRAEALAATGHYEDAIRDSLTMYTVAARRDGEHSFMAIAALNDVAENQCRAGHAQAGVASARRVYADATAIYGAKGAMTQTMGLTLAECLIAARQYDAAKPFLTSLDMTAVAKEEADPDVGAIVDLMKAQVSYADGDANLARRLLVQPRKVFGKAGADLYFSGNLVSLEAALSTSNPTH